LTVEASAVSEHTKGSVINLAAIRAQREKAATDRHIAILDATAAYFRERNRALSASAAQRAHAG